MTSETNPHLHTLSNAHRALLLELKDGRKRLSELEEKIDTSASHLWPRLQFLEERGWVENVWGGWWGLPFGHDHPGDNYETALPGPIRPAISPPNPVDFSSIEIPSKQPMKLTRRQFLLELIYELIREEGYLRDTFIGELWVELTDFKDTDNAWEWGLSEALRDVAAQDPNFLAPRIGGYWVHLGRR